MIDLARLRNALVLATALLVTAPVFAGFSGVDVYLPSVGRKPGVPPTQWYTAMWVHNPQSTPAHVRYQFLERDKSNTAPLEATETIGAYATRAYEDAITDLFHVQAFGAIRVISDQHIVVQSRIYSQTGAVRDSVGQLFNGIPAHFGVGAGYKTELVGVFQTQPADASSFRYNFGFVETVGGTVSARVIVANATGNTITSKAYTVRPYEQRQFQFKDEFPGVSTTNARLSVQVSSGTGRIIAFGSRIANGSQDPSTFEMQFNSELLGGSGSTGTITGVTAGNGLTGGGTTGTVTLNVGAGEGLSVSPDGVALANGGVTKAKLSADGGTSGQVLATDGTNLVWENPSGAGGGLSLPWEGSTSTSGDAFKVTNFGTVGASVAIRAESAGGYAILGSNLQGGQGFLGTPNGGVYGYGNIGVAGDSPTAWGVFGSGSEVGVYGSSSSSSGEGVYGYSPGSYGVHGESTNGDGVFGQAFDGNKSGVFAVNDNPAGYAAFMRGNAAVTGTLSKGGGAFRIDHPLDPEDKVLQHSFVESPDMKNVYDGVVVTDALGEAVVELPAYFEALNRDFRYQLTVIGEFAQAIIAEEIAGNRFVIRSDKAGVKVSWQVTGIRRDPWAEANRIVVEQDKPEAERGLYLHAAAYGAPPEKDVETVRHPPSKRPEFPEPAASPFQVRP